MTTNEVDAFILPSENEEIGAQREVSQGCQNYYWAEPEQFTCRAHTAYHSPALPLGWGSGGVALDTKTTTLERENMETRALSL